MFVLRLDLRTPDWESDAILFELKRPKYCLSVKQLGSGWGANLLGVSSGSKLFAYGTMVAIGRIRVNKCMCLSVTRYGSPGSRGGGRCKHRSGRPEERQMCSHQNLHQTGRYQDMVLASFGHLKRFYHGTLTNCCQLFSIVLLCWDGILKLL